MRLIIFSGGQTGADRGAHDAAIHLGLDRGGWAPHEFGAEDGSIPEIYASTMKQAADTGDHGRNLALRTRLNVQDTDATLIISFAEELTGGSKLTASQCKMQRKVSTHLVLPARGKSRITDAVRGMLLKWLRTNNVQTLNVAGPRESKEPGIQAAVRDALVWVLEDEVVEDLRQGAVVLEALGVVADSDAPRGAFAPALEYPLSPIRLEAIEAMARVAETEIAGAIAKADDEDALLASAAAGGPFWGVGKGPVDHASIVGQALPSHDCENHPENCEPDCRDKENQ